MPKLRMNLQYFAGEKTEKATPRRKQESRQKGQVAKSAELSSAIIFLMIFLLFYLFGSAFTQQIILFFKKMLNQYLIWEITSDNIRLLFLEAMTDMLWVVLPVFGLAIIAGIAGNLIQVGFLYTAEPLKLKPERLNPLEGAKRIFSKRALVELVKSILKVFLVGYIAFSVLMDKKADLLILYQYDLKDVMIFVGKLLLELGLKTSAVLIILSLLDYIYQKYDYEKNLRMSKQEIKEEYKKTEGDPLIKGKIKERQRQMAMSRMMQAVPEADVIITNPTHFAVALQYKPNEMDAPKVIAKGMDFIALKIKEVAKENDIVTVENKWLARALYFQVEIDDAVPSELFHAVAEILAYVYRIKGKIKS
ncbi:flagellar biosynthesis protein FlhB [Tepidibacillus sp. HK-1]|uniref:flagellar biosynthesis protein FlhB n=1 Tax=Tepidibacillus sp. HK-1 TaxID=1883407 RepID=UPI000853D9F5|nr:flagellar biosynthesis protein FlhB [Tepidibacillus sp. HK-1]GBF11617.1 flagellar biosynthetic protein FlhB [Tepidibacillus sp. HK-1]